MICLKLADRREELVNGDKLNEIIYNFMFQLTKLNRKKKRNFIIILKIKKIFINQVYDNKL